MIWLVSKPELDKERVEISQKRLKALEALEEERRAQGITVTAKKSKRKRSGGAKEFGKRKRKPSRKNGQEAEEVDEDDEAIPEISTADVAEKAARLQDLESAFDLLDKEVSLFFLNCGEPLV